MVAQEGQAGYSGLRCLFRIVDHVGQFALHGGGGDEHAGHGVAADWGIEILVRYEPKA